MSRPIEKTKEGGGLKTVSGRSLRKNIPFSALFELTGRCNLDCHHCYLDIRKPPLELDTSSVFNILQQLADAGTFFLTLSGGEIFLRPDIIEIAQKARSLGFALRIFSSGTRISSSQMDQIASLNLLAFEMSVYGACASTHDAVTRRPGSFAKTIATAKRLIGDGVPVVLKAPILTSVAENAQRFLGLCEEIGAVAKLDPAITIRRNGDRTTLSTRPSAEALAEVLRDNRVYGAEHPLPPPQVSEDAPCAIARRTCRVGANGLVYPCSTYPTSVGDLKKDLFADIWWGTSPLLTRLRSLRVADMGSTCSTCAQSGYCKRCLALSLLEHGDERAPSEESCRIAHAHTLAHASSDTVLNHTLIPLKKKVMIKKLVVIS